MRIKKLTKRWLVRHQACSDSEDVEIWAAMFPDGMELTPKNVWKCYKVELDVIWVACRLMTKKQRKKFIVFTLRQRQPHLAIQEILGAVLGAAWIDAWYAAKDAARTVGVAAYNASFDTRVVVRDAAGEIISREAVARAVGDAAGEATTQMQIEWCIKELLG